MPDGRVRWARGDDRLCDTAEGSDIIDGVGRLPNRSFVGARGPALVEHATFGQGAALHSVEDPTLPSVSHFSGDSVGSNPQRWGRVSPHATANQNDETWLAAAREPAERQTGTTSRI